MPRRLVDQPEAIELVSILDEAGNLDTALEPAIPAEDLRRLYRTMLLTRRFEARIVALQRQGRVSTALSSLGQEAVALGAAYAIGPGDWMVPYFRELAAYLWRGWSLDRFLLYLAGYVEGMRVPDGARDLPLCIPIASQLPHAVGLAYAAQYLDEPSVVLAFLGDGATSEGDFHEALNFAGVFQVPVVFCCANNQWAISVPRSRQTRARTLARKATAYGMPGIQADGNDLLAVYSAIRWAVDRARAGEGPALVECLTYRLAPHSTSDDPARYRDPEEARAWEAREPMLRFRRYLEARGLLTEAEHAALEAEVAEEIRAAVERAERWIAAHGPLPLFDHVYAELPEELRDQQAEIRAAVEGAAGA